MAMPNRKKPAEYIGMVTVSIVPKGPAKMESMILMVSGSPFRNDRLRAGTA